MDSPFKFLLAALALAALGGGGLAVYQKTRGLRNNNPGNIRRSADNWKGLSEKQNDKSFFQFTAPRWGIRAMARILKNYARLYRISTIDGVVQRWAPNTENDTEAYAKFISSETGLSRTQFINLENDSTLEKIIPAIIAFENGIQPYTAEKIKEGIALA